MACNAVDEEWISEKHDEDIGYQAVEPLELLELLCDAGGDLDDLEITDLNTKMLEPWDGVEAPVTTFAQADKYERQLERHSIPKQPELRLSYAVSTYQTSGQFDAAMQEWHAKIAADKTFPKFRVYIQDEYVDPQMVTNSIRKRGLPIWEYSTLPAHFRTETPHMEMGSVFLATSKSRIEENLPPNFGQEIKIFPLSHFCDTLKELCVPNISSIARLPIIRSIALITIIASFSFGDCLNPCASVFPFGDYLPPRSILQGL